MKKLLAFIFALTVCTACFSCEGKNNKSQNSSPVSKEESPDTTGMTAVKLSDAAYQKKSIELPSDINMIYCSNVYNGGNNYLLLGSGKKSPQFWITDRDFTEFKEIDYPDFNVGANYNITVLDDGTAVTFVNNVDYGDLPAPDTSSPDYSQEEYDAAASYSFRIYTYAPDGSVLTANDVTGCPVTPERDISISGMASDGKTLVVNINGTYEVFSIDGTYIGELTVDDGCSAECIGSDKDGNIICAVRTDSESVQFCKVNSEGKAEKTDLTYKFPETVSYDIVPGSGDYSMYVSSMTTIYGIRADDNTIESLFSLNAAGLNSSNFSDFSIGSDGNFIVPVTSYSDWSVSLKSFTPCDPAELENIPTITVGMFYEDEYFSSVVEDFNENNSDCRIKVKYYQENNHVSQNMDFNDEEAMDAYFKKIDEAHDSAVEKLRQDVTKGTLPDVLVLDGGSDITGIFGGVDLAGTGALCDLYDFMDKDETLTRESFVPSVLNAADRSFDGHVYSIPTNFSIRLDNTAKTKFVKDVKKWDFDTYMDYIENENEIIGYEPPEESSKTQYERSTIINHWHWIDKEKAECHFDSPQFLRFLEYCQAGEPDPEPDENYVYEEPSEEESRQNYIDQQCRYIEDKALLNNSNISRYMNYLYEIKGTFGNEDVTVLGEVDGKMDTAVFSFPHSQYAIPECCENKELAWKFIKYRLSDKCYKDAYNTGGGFPVTNSGLEIYKENDQQPQNNEYSVGYEDYTGYLYPTGYRDENGNTKYLKLGNLTDDDIATVDKYIAGAVLSSSPDRASDEYTQKYNDVYDIYHEELQRMFHNETTPEECAYMLQNRISIYLSENFG